MDTQIVAVFCLCDDMLKALHQGFLKVEERVEKKTFIG